MAQTLNQLITSLTTLPARQWRRLLLWPPDLFAVLGVALERTGAYIHLVSPPPDRCWPPCGESRDAWAARVTQCAQAWVSWLDGRWHEVARGNIPDPDVLPAAGALPASLRRPVRDLEAHLSLALTDLHEHFDAVCAIQTLFAICDETAAALFTGRSTYIELLRARLSLHNTMCRSVAPAQAQVFPKFAIPSRGMHLRSLSHFMGLLTNEVSVQLTDVYPVTRMEQLNLLLLPWPYELRPEAFRPAAYGQHAPEDVAHGYFDLSPSQTLDDAAIARLLGAFERAQERCGEVDLIVLPELSVTEEELAIFHDALTQRIDALNESEERRQPISMPLLLAGVRAASTPTAFGQNKAVLRDIYRQPFEQHKHHRWALERNQLRDYGLCHRLSQDRVWWEASSLSPREVLVTPLMRGQLALCALICEDLARQEPVPHALHTIGPGLIIALLLDGAQVNARWPGRFAHVLADDPGAAVLTFTCLGSVRLHDPPGYPTNGEVAMWTNPGSSWSHTLRLERHRTEDRYMDGIVLELRTTNPPHALMTADGRSHHTSRVALEYVRHYCV